MHFAQHPNVSRMGSTTNSSSSRRGSKPLRTRKACSDSTLDDHMKWLVIDIPCCSTTASRKSADTEDGTQVFRDKDFVIDSWGLRRISPCILPRRPEKDLQMQSFMLDRDPCPSVDDDCLSVASTVADDSQRAHPSCSYPSRLRPSNLRALDKKEQIGQGSCGVVWRAVNVESDDGRSFAVKELPYAAAADEEKRRILIEELRLAYRVDHAHIVPTVEVFYAAGVFSLVMEFMDGGSLLDALKSSVAAGRGGLSCAALAHVARSVCEGLTYLHEDLRVVHRDIKPSNILLSSSSAVKIGDLGICSSPDADDAQSHHHPAGDHASAQWIGTVTYMSPERIVGDRYSYNADVWSLGVVLAEACLCRYPYNAPATLGRSLQFWDLLDLVLTGPCPSDAVAAHLQEEAAACAADAHMHQMVSSLVRDCLAKDMSARPTARACLAHPLLSARHAAAGRAEMLDWMQRARAGAAASSASSSQQQQQQQQQQQAGSAAHGGAEAAACAGPAVPPHAPAAAAAPPRVASSENLLEKLAGVFKALGGGGAAAAAAGSSSS